jgi:transcriptional regulator with XRE-family HTH domain
MFMAKQSKADRTLPGAVSRALNALGENLRIGRIRREESLRARALRMGISVPTLRRMETGDPSVSIGVYANALWLMQREALLPELANPGLDDQALLLQLSRLERRR